MRHEQFDMKTILFESIREALIDEEVSDDDLAAFEFAYNGMYESDISHNDTSNVEPPTNAPGLTGEQLTDATIIAIAFNVGKFFLTILFEHIAKNKILPSLDDQETRLIKITNKPQLIKNLRNHIEKNLCKYLDIPPEKY